MGLPVRELWLVAVTCWVIAAFCVGLFVTGLDVWSGMTAVAACGACGAGTYEWLIATNDRSRW